MSSTIPPGDNRSTPSTPTLPKLIEEDIQALNDILRMLLVRTGATTALLMDIGGFLITSQGEATRFDLTNIAAMTSATYMANQTIAGLVTNRDFDSFFQQGEQNSLFVSRVDTHCLLAVIFEARVKVGTVKYFAMTAVRTLAQQIESAAERSPGAGFDLSVLNRVDSQNLFRKGQ
jgi:predicted regulator of Ras-like GTPase activity (Roadblock/LC7/MglB family)